jgi:chorismate--pyruvate lyase
VIETVPASTAPALWLPAGALGCYEGDARMRSWLVTPGLLTERVRATAGATFSLVVLGEDASHGEHRRTILLGTRAAPWIYAETSIPDASLATHPWLARMGEVSLGEELTARGGTRSDFAYARLTPDAPLVARALARTALPPQTLWIRRSEFSIAGAPLTVQEAFLPGIGVAGLDTHAARIA